MENEIQVSRLTPENPDDAQKVLEFMQQYEEGPPTRGAYYYAKTHAGNVVGYLRSNPKPSLMSTPNIHLTDICAIEVVQVDPSTQGKGVGKRLVNLVEDEHREGVDKLYVDGSLNNSFWNHMGYQPVKDGAVILVKNLK